MDHFCYLFRVCHAGMKRVLRKSTQVSTDCFESTRVSTEYTFCKCTQVSTEYYKKFLMSTSEYYEYYKVCNENLRQEPN